MGGVTDTLDLARLGLSSGEGRALSCDVRLEPLALGGQRYSPRADRVAVRVEISHTTTGYALRLRSAVALEGPCMRCLEDAFETVELDALEVDQPGGGEDLRSPYLDGDELDLAAWTRDALVLALPARIVCAADCRGLCGVCGASLNEEPDHEHPAGPDPRWAKLSELKLD